MEIYLIRHSMTEGNKEKRYIGTTDEPLCAEGIELLKEYSGRYPKPAHIYISPMKRCIQSAEIIYPQMMMEGKYSIMEDLRECDFGRFENHNYIELSGDMQYQAWIDSGGKLPFPDGESREGFTERTRNCFRDVLKDALQHSWARIAVVAHGGTVMSIMEEYARGEDGQSAGSYYDYQVENGEGYELRITENDLYDGGTCGRLFTGSDVRGSKVAVSSGAPDRTSDLGNGTNYKKLPSGK